ncbi:MAG TPA: hypothetical protein VK430_00255 [Xanthobacteraceae bacterium]|nr:hypothetical protein [Xanthobacteraceae bacterium]
MPKKPWDIPPRPSTYDKDPEELFAAVGGALSSWQYVEDAIASLFEAIVSDGDMLILSFAKSMSPAKRAYGSIVSFDARAEMVEAAADAFFHVHHHPRLHKRMRSIMQACRGWSARRNEIAHGKIGGAPTDLNYCALWPADSSTRKNEIDHRAKFVYNAALIKEFDHHFLTLHSPLLDTATEFRAWRAGLRARLGLYPPPDDSLSDQELAQNGPQ